MSTKLALSVASILLLNILTATSAYAEVAGTPLWQAPEAPAPAKTAPAGTPPAPRKHRTPAKRDAAGTNKSTDALEAEVFGDEPAPTVRRPPADDETYGGARTRATGNLPAVVAPHMVAFALGTELISRNFQFNAGSSLQGDAGAPRAGIAAAIESFPFLSLDNPQLGRIGFGASFETEVGNAGIGQPDNGTLIYPFTETRWGFDVRFAIPIAERFLLLPRFGYGHLGYDLQRRNQPAPSLCATTSSQVCLPDVQLSHLTLGVDARLALAPSVGLALGLEYLPGFGLGAGTGQLGSESNADVQGMAATLTANWQLLDWLALRASVPITHYGYTFSRRPLAYTSASETYYGLVVGATVFTH